MKRIPKQICGEKGVNKKFAYKISNRSVMRGFLTDTGAMKRFLKPTKRYTLEEYEQIEIERAAREQEALNQGALERVE